MRASASRTARRARLARRFTRSISCAASRIRSLCSPSTRISWSRRLSIGAGASGACVSDTGLGTGRGVVAGRSGRIGAAVRPRSAAIARTASGGAGVSVVRSRGSAFGAPDAGLRSVTRFLPVVAVPAGRSMLADRAAAGVPPFVSAASAASGSCSNSPFARVARSAHGSLGDEWCCATPQKTTRP